MIGEKIKKYRNKKNLTKADLSRMTGISSRSIEFLEHGKTNNPTLKTLKALSKALDVNIKDLIE